ncbi:MAG TPA: choice-of-anchor tandem repeat GloVer-containing protein, partial [Methylocystis sp.]|nr:choice-of-anchor tandem repeat GloVer-containing protein [Methylocystis sp.]
MAFLKTSKNCLRASHLRLAASLAAVVAAAELSHPAAAKTYAELLQFNGTNGAGPQSGVLFDGGVLYGVTAGGGSAGDGVVYSLSPLANGQWSFNVIYNFLGGTLDGATPIGGLVADASGILYGTTSAAGGAGQGTVFQLIPPSTPAGTWTEKTLYNFQGGANDGSAPLANLIIDTEGNLYGATSAGGAAGEGVVFELSPPKSAGGEWTETVLYAFKGGASDGSTPTAGPTFGPQGALYGTTIGGGALGLGVAFELAPPSGSTTTWTETILFDFLG